MLSGIRRYPNPPIRDKRVVVDGRELVPRIPFALLFTGPAAPVIGNRLHVVRHSEAGAMRIYLSPFRQDEDGTLYESVFN